MSGASRSTRLLGRALLAGLILCGTGCEDCDDGECQDTLQISLIEETWDPGEYRVTIAFEGKIVVCLAVLPITPTYESSCTQDPPVRLLKGPSGTDMFRTLVILDVTPTVIEMQWELDGVQFADVRIVPNYRKLTREEYPRVCGRPCEHADEEASLD